MRFQYWAAALLSALFGLGGASRSFRNSSRSRFDNAVRSWAATTFSAASRRTSFRRHRSPLLSGACGASASVLPDLFFAFFCADGLAKIAASARFG